MIPEFTRFSTLLEVIVPQKIEPSPHDRKLSGKGHDLPDASPVILPVAVDCTMLARRFRVEGAFAEPFHGIGHEPRTVGTEGNRLPEGIAQLLRDINLDLSFSLSFMLRTTVDPHKIDQDLQVGLLFLRELSHVAIVKGKYKG